MIAPENFPSKRPPAQPRVTDERDSDDPSQEPESSSVDTCDGSRLVQQARSSRRGSLSQRQCLALMDQPPRQQGPLTRPNRGRARYRNFQRMATRYPWRRSGPGNVDSSPREGANAGFPKSKTKGSNRKGAGTKEASVQSDFVRLFSGTDWTAGATRLPATAAGGRFTTGSCTAMVAARPAGEPP